MKKTLALLMASTVVAHCAERAKDFTEENRNEKSKLALANNRGATIQTNRSPYVPLIRGAPKNRFNGGSRGPGEMALYVITPEHTGCTAKQQPSLYWFQSKTNVNVLLTLRPTNENAAVLLETNINAILTDGFGRLDLARYNVSLQEGMEYVWFVEAARNGENASGDALASGHIARIKVPETLNRKLAGASEARTSAIYAGEGLWYEAIEALFSQIKAHPDDPELLKQRDAYLRDVGLTNIVSTLRAK